MAQNLAADVIDLGIQPADVDSFWLLGVTTTVTATGFFVDKHHQRTGDSFTVTIPHGDGVNDPVKLASDIPSVAVGAYVRLTGDLFFDLQPPSGSAGSDFKTNYARYPKLIASADYDAFGRVA